MRLKKYLVCAVHLFGYLLNKIAQLLKVYFFFLGLLMFVVVLNYYFNAPTYVMSHDNVLKDISKDPASYVTSLRLAILNICFLWPLVPTIGFFILQFLFKKEKK
ncbi:hypothetical protein [Fructobacillus cardui]|uniref:hypothetical protein n=1 Tax=Fructobacillus cardui TaxID=2893170 RepID=UPI002DABD6D0|nr:unnamed protein product [Fructobacillus cardui]